MTNAQTSIIGIAVLAQIKSCDTFKEQNGKINDAEDLEKGPMILVINRKFYLGFIQLESNSTDEDSPEPLMLVLGFSQQLTI